MARIPNIQLLVNSLKIEAASVSYSIESGLVRVETLESVLYSQSNKILTVEIEAPPLPDGYQIDAWNAIVEESLVELAFMLPGGKIWRSNEANVMSTSGGQSAGAGQTQNVTIEVPLNSVPK